MKRVISIALLTGMLAVIFTPILFAGPADQPPPGVDKFVRLRGSVEIHCMDCIKVKRADPGGVVEAKWGDGPPCYTCLRPKMKDRSRPETR